MGKSSESILRCFTAATLQMIDSLGVQRHTSCQVLKYLSQLDADEDMKCRTGEKVGAQETNNNRLVGVDSIVLRR